MISVIIPALNEEQALPATLDNLMRQGGDFEIIVVDGGSSDQTRSLAEAHAGVHVIESARGRATQMNAGARQAVGDWLLFLHADTLLPDGAIVSIENLPTHVLAGGFRHRFSGHSFSVRLVSRLHNLRCRITRVFYGDQAPFFRREFFTALGEYPQTPILEDVLLGERVAAETKPLIMRSHVITDSRKFEKEGVWRSFWRVLVILARHELKLPIRSQAFFRAVR
ncbi:MAG: TIGR04283 family arsenosugar biosynthesis glycosyltransferase [Chromatiales bacterium]|nr:TIGR04283 family arsenosugar biosynthesis glycosyltransferase [Chromatiales bacterium]